MAAQVDFEKLELQPIDHLGLVAGLIKRYDLVRLIDQHLPVSREKGSIVSHGQRVAAMIINGLGFTAKPLYLSPKFFESKPVSRLLGNGIEAKHLNDDALGRTLDAISEFGCTSLFSALAFLIGSKANLLGQSAKLDTTSLKLFGEYYEVDEKDGKKPPQPALGYSKDHRSDLKQLVMSLMVSGPSSIPLWFEGLDGNSQDKKSFHETIERVRAFQQSLKSSASFLWVADSALYHQGKLKNTTIRFLTRIPATLKKVKQYYQQDKEDFTWEDLTPGYQSCWVDSNEPKKERWLLIHSEQAAKKQNQTLLRRIARALKQAETEAKKQKAIHFACEQDANKAAARFEKTLKYHQLTQTITPIYKHDKQGRPKRGEKARLNYYQLSLSLEKSDVKCKPYENKVGRFILGTNDIQADLTAEQMLTTYKEEQDVERGFRFIKDPCFQLNKVFLKKPERIEALMMVMTLCLMIYNLGQHQIREQLKIEKQTLPNQKGKEVTNPTLRWIFQMMHSITVARYSEQAPQTMGLNDNKRKIIRLFGNEALRIYDLKS
ncbi:MAG: IS1634 family transposase [Gammaproteobacteria bacterium]|nr:IS1634 family transposase [Gammaproteobacteria bacterium]